MSMVAQTRDLNDRKTIADFAEQVQSLDRLKMLLILTVCDIRAVGPGVWNGWKGQLAAHALLRDRAAALGRLLRSVAQGAGETCRRSPVQRSVRLEPEGPQDLYQAALPALPAVGAARGPGAPCALHPRGRQGRPGAGDHGAHPSLPCDHRNHRSVARPSAPARRHRRCLRCGRRQYRRCADLHDLRWPGARHDPDHPRISGWTRTRCDGQPRSAR